MSSGQKIPFADAYRLAERIAGELRPLCRRVKAVGSLRRRRPYVRDLEFLLEPETSGDLFGGEQALIEPVRNCAARLGTLTKDGHRYVQFTTNEVAVDLFLCYPPAEWGSLLAIRTGPATLGHLAMLQFQQRGLIHSGGGLYRGHVSPSTKIPVPDEETFFRLAGLPCLPPHKRDRREAHTPIREAACTI
ncbi:MAG TPA: hypothetical protein VF167_00020 [Longimicrobiaceae bacterium]